MTAAVYVPYVSDNGTTYQRKTLADLATALGLTPEALGAHARLPRSVQSRYVLGKDPGSGREHKLRGPDTTSGVWTGATATLDVPDPSNRTATITLNLAGRVAEKRYFR